MILTLLFAPRNTPHSCSATTVVEWKGSWTASKFAGEHGLLLARVSPYEAQYNLSSHRGVDRPFKLGKTPKMYTFVKPNGIIAVPRDIQLCCRHELHIVIPDDDNANVAGGRGEMTICSLDQILAGDAIETIIQDTCVPDGVRVEVPSRQILEIHESHGSSRIAVFLIVYCSERYPVTRDMADSWRENVESEVEKYVQLRENRRGRTVSHPFPYPALHPEVSPLYRVPFYHLGIRCTIANHYDEKLYSISLTCAFCNPSRETHLWFPLRSSIILLVKANNNKRPAPWAD